MTNRILYLDLVTEELFSLLQSQVPEGFELVRITEDDSAHVRSRAKGADYFLVGWFGASAEAIDAALPRLQLIQKLGIGLDRVDVEHARSNGVAVALTAGANAPQVAEHTVMLMLAVLRMLPQGMASLAEGRWAKAELRVQMSELYDKRVGLIGFGNIGRRVAQRVAAFDAEVVYHDPYASELPSDQGGGPQPVDLETLLDTSDVVSLHLPATPETAGLIDRSALARMKPGAVLVNTARGKLIDETALVDALDSGALRGVGLDVFANEPPPSNHALFQHPRAVVTPHVGGSSRENVPRIARRAFENIVRFSRGESMPAADLVATPQHAHETTVEA